MEYCPDKYSNNCAYLGVMCNRCRANEWDSLFPLMYKPIRPNLGLSTHPCFIAIREASKLKYSKEPPSLESIEAKRVSRVGRTKEVALIKSMKLARTVNSGATNGDGDAKLVIGPLELGVEIKTRVKGKHCLGPTKPEWDKGLRQGVDIFITSSTELGEIITMSRHTLEQLIDLIKEKHERRD